RLLFCKVGTQHCPDHDQPISAASPHDIASELLERFPGERLFLFAPVVSGRKGYYTELFARALRADIGEARIDDEIVGLSEDLRLERHKLHWISLLTSSVTASPNASDLLAEAIQQALILGNGTLEVAVGKKSGKPELFSVSRVCPTCKRGFRELDPQDFSFRSARGMCEGCLGHGTIETAHGDEPCSVCDGSRIGPVGRHVYLNGKTIHDYASLTAPNLLAALEKLSLPKRLDPVVSPIMTELCHLLSVITSIGLDYISLDRESSTLSGGEAQRLRLARSLGSPLSGVCYVLDEPTIGLHPQDHAHLLALLRGLRDEGNTVVVVEHDEETIRAADHIIDLGPSGGARGGQVLAAGTVDDIIANESSPTGWALRDRAAGHTTVPPETPTRRKDVPSLVLSGASANNLRNVDVAIPLERLTVVCGVSGAGKSSLVHGSLVPAVFDAFDNTLDEPRTWRQLKNHDALERFIEIDQNPVGKTPSSCPASYLKIFDDIRKLYASLPEAEMRGWGPSHFSYNSSGGRCEHCSGRG
ncbi:MAG: hypothetical protein KDD44_10925, partial [Bdellovibrionales bacterium]|nr:hypothetical protein [Bdellovibrionales bacterium]